MFNTNNRFSKQNEGSRPENTEGKAKLVANYNGNGTEITFEAKCSGIDLLNMYASISKAFLDAGINATDLVAALASAEARRITGEE